MGHGWNIGLREEEDRRKAGSLWGYARKMTAFADGEREEGGGVGFNSVYHLTDLPSFVSDKYVVLFDPHREYLPNVSSSNPGKRLDFVSSSAISFYKDQFFPFCAFGCDMKRPFLGTLFRFPLRSACQAAVSKLSRQSYLEDDLFSMFSQFYKETTFTMLFLKNIISIELYVWDAGANEPQKIYSCSINSVNEHMSWHRQTVLRLSKSTEIEKRVSDSFSLDFLCESYGTHSERRIDTFFIVQAMASSSSKIGAFAATAVKEYDLHLLPWASIAACISGDLSEGDVLRQGQAFCFLPLPIRTGLKVHVNGYFEVSSNRRSIWHGDDMDRGGKLRSAWNILLLEHVLAPAFCELLVGLSKVLGPTELYYSLWPSGSFEEPWNVLVEHIYESIVSCPVMYSNVGGGKWISPLEGFFHDMEFYRSSDLGEVLILLGMPVVYLPKLVVEMMFLHIPNFWQRAVSPAIVRNFLKKCELLVAVSRYHKLILLEYCLSDLIDAEVGKHALGLPLVPLANGGFGSFGDTSSAPSFFLCSELESKLLDRVSDQIIDHTIPPELFNRLSAVATASTTNIMIFDAYCLQQILPRILPAEWKSKSGIRWDANSCPSHPTASWFMLFWQYLHGHCHDLSIFNEWPILPSTSGHLYRTSRVSKLIDARPLSVSLKNVLVKIGCKILDPTYGVEHKELNMYVYEANGAGILDAIFEVVHTGDVMFQMLFQDLSAVEKSELCQFFLDARWYYGGIMDESRISNCKRLPIFRVHGLGPSPTMLFSDLENHKRYLPPYSVPEHILGSDFLCCSSHTDEEILQRYLGMRRMERTIFYKENVFNRISELSSETRDKVMLDILRDLPQLCSDDSSFKESLRDLEFVPTIKGSLKSPQSLYDPRVDDLYTLLEDCECFPHGLFQEPDVLGMLQNLGLRTSVSAETIIQSARQIETLLHIDQLKAYSRGKVLLSYLEVNAIKWVCRPPIESQRKMNWIFLKGAMTSKFHDMSSESDLERFWNELRMICWCPVLVTPPCSFLPWPSVSSMVAPPKLVRLQVDLWLVSASMRILDGECSSSALSSCLGWFSSPGGSIVAAQLLELGKNNEIVTDQLLRQELTLAMPKIYSLLMSLIGSDEIDIVKAVLEGSRWIWVGDGFATVDEVILSGHLHLAPYIRVIPIDLAVFRELFLELGVQESLKPIDYATILHRMSKRKDCDPLDRQELDVAVFVAHYLAEVHHQDLQTKIYLPDFSSRMFPATDLVYNDAPWLLDFGDNLTRKTSNIELYTKKNALKFVHGNISNDVAEKLGVRSFRRILLAESSDSMNLSLSGVAEAFGQHEALTTRLKHIIEMYADGPGILFELVQNAEDAGACEVAFLLDKTHYGTSSILSPEMAEWQGPALYCFNNSIFSSQDLYAISRIGQDSKLEKPFSIGRFGLGFNSVYHFTDIPGFVSGENIVIFDPHTSYLPGISPSHPGLRIRFVGKSVLGQFPDQFTPFLHFGCDLQNSFPGTLFRFPLRGEIAASRSQIKKEKYSPEDVQSLFSSFSEVIPEALLFLRNVKTISIYMKDGPDHGMQLIYAVSRHKVDGPEKELHPLHDLLSFVHGNPKGGLTKEKFFDKLHKTLDNDLPWHCQKIAIMERNLSSEKLHFWMISECIGGGHAKAKSLSLANRSHSFIPWGCVAACLYSVNARELLDNHGNEEHFDPESLIKLPPPECFMKDVKELVGRAFCFLPLPISTGLPVHLNAYFELSANRRDIWFGNDMAGGGKARSEWNSSLLGDVVAPAYAHFLDIIAAEIGPSDLFFSFWPTVVGIEPWASLVKKVYRSVADLGLCLLYTRARGGQWISTRQGIFPDFTFLKGNDLTEVLSEAGFPLITVPKAIMERFIDSCPSLHVMTPALLRKLLIRRKRELHNRDAMVMMLEYCLSDKERSLTYDDMNGLPLIPLANGTFTTFKKHKDGERIFIASQDVYILLRDLVPHLLVDCMIPEATFKMLQSIAESGVSNLSLLTCQSVVELLPRILPPEWHDTKQVTWNPGLAGHPTVEWIQLLWSYLNSHCSDLSMFSKWPILPVGDCYLFQLVKNSNIIRNDGWSENMLSLLHKLGCFLLRSDIQMQHVQLMKFVQDPTASGILNAMQAVTQLPQGIADLFIKATDGEIHELRSFLLQSKWFFGNQMETQHIDMIKVFPLFESYRSRKFVSLTNPTKWLKPEGIHEDLLDESFIRTESEREKIILKSYLGVKEPSKIEFYRDHVLNKISDFLQPTVLPAIFIDLKHLIDLDSSVKIILSETPFVLSANGSSQYPSRLYDPRIPGLKKLLHKDCFPCDKFSNAEMLDTLVCLGLKRTLDFTGLLDSAKSVSSLHDSCDLDALNHGRRLFSCLNALCFKLALRDEVKQHETNEYEKNDFLVMEDSEIHGYDECMKLDPEIYACFGDFKDKYEDGFWSEMRTISWCPVCINPPIEGIPWSSSTSHVASPNITRPKSQMWFVSSMMRVLDAECSSTYLQDRLGWLDLPNVTVLCTQLVDISKLYHHIQLGSEKKSHLESELQREIPALYSKLQCLIGTDGFGIAKTSLKGVQWVWVGDNFVSSTALAFDSPIKYPPYLYVVPSELSEFRPLLSGLGVKLAFEILDYLHVLQRLQHDLKGELLSSEQLNFVLCVLEAIADCSGEKSLSDAYMSSLLVPDSNGGLIHAMDVVYNDAPWMEKNGPVNKHFTHPNISDDLAKKLGLQSLRSLSLVNDELTKDLPCMDYSKITELLALYGNNDFLLFDLLELADCCSARKVHLIHDKREHPRQSLLQHNLGEFQGPSVLVIMEGVTLSRDELCNLQFSPPWKLRGATVNYGLGLLSCHFVSDLLSVLSGGYLYMFDPLGLAFAPHSTVTPSAKVFSLIEIEYKVGFCTAERIGSNQRDPDS
ncbi:hypothetical protein Taro_017078 [Colocasia esculenta]|uniref:Sacsin/Nov domain-containing protein n=1 Tax=Colocasia esculenta TaxID=4460 RepID=A0A843USA7_COLES|nr:hypothetical protein [Colocasia esculenta]